MGVRTVHVSDLSEKPADEKDLGKLIVHEHPSYTTPIVLEVLPEEIGDLPEGETYIRVEYVPPGEASGQRVVLTTEQFNGLARSGDMNAILMRVIAETAQLRAEAALPARRRRAEGRGEGAGPRRARGSYATLEHAGEPHRGRITDAEKQIVREHLDEVNARLREKGMREIDPSDARLAERYGL